MTKSRKKLWTGLCILALLTPMGVILPERLNAGGAWGEWGPEALGKLVGYVPDGLKKVADLWKAPVPDYNFGGEGASMTVQVVSYIASGIIGLLAAGLLIYIIARMLMRHEK
jgi:hypothetical protein